MSRTLLITVQLHEARYHGMGDDPPSPARLFQALVAGIGLSGPPSSRDLEALKWLEELSPPIIASPIMTTGQLVKNYVPNNDFDAVDGDPRRIAEIRTPKVIKPHVFNGELPFLYAWAIDDNDESKAQAICALAERLYQFGRGVDLAWAWGEILDEEELEDRLSSYSGLIYHPSRGGTGRMLACPQNGSLKSLEDRYAANSQRFTPQGLGKGAKQLFSQAPKPRFEQVPYESPSSRRVYELRDGSSESSFARWPLARVSQFVVELRNRAVERLRAALPAASLEIERFLVGRKADGTDDGPTFLRVRIMPLPSVGHHHADRQIRRVLVEVPPGCPLRSDDVHWAFSGLELFASEIGAAQPLVVTPSSDESMFLHYGIGNGTSRLWRTVTPVALPEPASRRRIEPARMAAEAKNGLERAAEQKRAAGAVIQALRFVGVRTWAESIRVQREPFEATGERAEAFAPATRFSKQRLWHVEIMFTEPIKGPLVIGDGRFLGLGIMAPVR
jgi:CRISPR-associated protein Csb2